LLCSSVTHPALSLSCTLSIHDALPISVAPTIFDADGRLDLEGQKRAIDFMIDAGSHGICILANFSEQFVLTDDERDLVMTTVLRSEEHTSELQSRENIVCRLLLEKKN